MALRTAVVFMTGPGPTYRFGRSVLGKQDDKNKIMVRKLVCNANELKVLGTKCLVCYFY